MKREYVKTNYFNFLLDKSQYSLLNNTGVYKIGFKNSNNFYIGSTTENFKQRLRRHLCDLEKNKHCNLLLQKSYNKY